MCMGVGAEDLGRQRGKGEVGEVEFGEEGNHNYSESVWPQAACVCVGGFVSVNVGEGKR